MQRFLRTEALVGKDGLERLQKTHITVVGLGGVGGAALEGLVRGGIGAVTLIDFDTLSLTNCNRQLLALTSTVGRSKAEVAAERMAEINPRLQITLHDAKLGEENLRELIAATDYVVDCIDDVPAKLLLAEYCREHHIPLVMCMGTGNRLSSEGLKIANFDRTEGCPLAKKMRLLLKNARFRKLRCLYSDSPVTPAFPIEDGGKRTVGSISYVPTIAGLKLAEQVINRILKEETSLDIPK